MTVTRVSPKKAIAAENQVKEKKYWLEKLAGYTERTGLPYDFYKPAPQHAEGSSYSVCLATDLYALLTKVSNGSDARLHMLLLSGLPILLHKLTSKTELVISTPVYTTGTEGELLNTILPIKMVIRPELSFKDTLLQVRQTLLEASEHQNYPIELLPEQLHLASSTGFPLFEIGMLLENIQELRYLESVPHQLIFSFRKTDQEVWLTVHYQASRYAEATVKRTVGFLEEVLRATLSNVDQAIKDIAVLSAGEKQTILRDFNNTQTAYPTSQTLVALLEEQVEQTPDAIALVYEGITYTYRQLNTSANQLAHCIREKELIQPGDLVGLLMDRAEKAIISLLAILKTGGAYLPLDPELPEERLRFMLADAAVKMLICGEKQVVSITSAASTPILVLEEVWSELPSRPLANPTRINKASDLAYSMYTSGSTGTPKGVMVEHRNIVRLVKNTNYVVITPDDRMLQAAPLSFDAATFEVWGALLHGASLHIAPKETLLDPLELEGFLQQNPVTIGWLTASLFNTLAESNPRLFSTLRTLLVGGEALSPGHINKVRNQNKDLTLINGYGPTENTTFSACFTIDTDYQEAIPIGRPIANSRCYVLNDFGDVQPIGVPGELYVAGDGVARGYLNNEALTRERFLEDPFVPGQRMYKTGDQAKWLPDGILAFMGRKDDQVKIRGYRVEPAEVQHALLTIDGIREAVVVVRGDQTEGTLHLGAYLVANQPLDPAQVRAALAKQLPEYMIPAYFVGLEALPLTVNGKVDTRALPAPQSEAEQYRRPTNEVEEKLVAIWAEVLGMEKEQISTQANFFLLGGHSFKAARMLSQIHKELDAKLSLKNAFELTTIAALAEYIQSIQPDRYQTILKAEQKRFYPLSSAQKRLYMLQQMEVDSTSYNLPSIAILEGRLDKERLETTFQQLIERHESLRTSFELVLGQTFQKIHPSVAFAIEHSDASADDERPEDIITQFVRPFLLNKAPLLRVGLKAIAEDKHYLMVDMHHIISDGVSEAVFRKDFMALYGQSELPPMRLQYKDFSEWKTQAAQKEAIKAQEAYWLATFSAEPPILQLPTDYPRPAVQRFEGNALHFQLPYPAVSALRALALQEGATLYSVLLSVFTILLAKLSGQEDILVGTPVAGRRHADFESIIGVFVNTLVLRNYPTGNKSFRTFLSEVQSRALEAFDNQEYQFEDLVEKVVVSRDTSRNPLFSVMFNYHNIGTVQVEIPGLKLLPFEEEQKVSKFDLSLDVLELDDELSFAVEYGTHLFKPETIQRVIHYFTSLVSTMSTQPDIRIGDVQIITEAEREQVVHTFNIRTLAYRQDQTIHQQVEEQAAQSPDAVAIEFEGEVLTYADLNQKANQVAHLLRKKGVKPDTVVGIMVDRSLDLAVGLVGILKAGGAYLPIDPHYPEARKQYMLADSQVTVVLTQQPLLEASPSLFESVSPENLVCLDDAGLYEGESGNPEPVNQPHHLAYVVYTSGTTGEAKGIMVEHRNLVAYLASFNELFEQTSADSTLQLTSISFDIFAEQFWGTLVKGGRMIIPKEEAVKDVEKLARMIRRHKITLVSCPPLMLNELNKQNPFASVRAFISGGDVLKPEYVSHLHTYSKVYNGYGPAETTIGATHYRYDSEEMATIPIGPPMSNYRIYILDTNEKPLPVGVPGELCISGPAVSRGYMGKPQLTAQKFVPDPFVLGQRMYKTGDMAKWLSDGTIDFIGRLDQQVKIRGYRIELGEIETLLRKHEAITESLVIAREDKKEKYLCAYYQAAEELDIASLRAFLLQGLPDYMVPAYFVRIDRIPVTPNGKVHIKELPEPTLKAGATFVAPRNPMEARLVAIWSAVLEADQDNISVETDFFSVGGNSINATQLIAKIQKEFAITMPLVEAFKAPNIMLQAIFVQQELDKKQREAASLEEQLHENEAYATKIFPANTKPDAEVGPGLASSDEEAGMEAVPQQAHYALSSGQRRMYILNQLDKGATNYNMFGAFEITGYLDRDQLEQVIEKLIGRHESFRTHFEMVDGEMAQFIREEVNFTVEYFDQVAENQVQAIIEGFIRPFDLSKAPLLRVGLITLRAERSILLMDTHHIVTDGVSMQLLIEEFARLSHNEQLPALRYQYKDYAYWQQKRMHSANFKKHEQYWLEHLSGELPVLSMPTDFPRPFIQRFEGSTVEFELDAATTSRLRTVSNETGATMYMILLAAYQILFHKYTGQSDVLVGSPVAVRPVNDFEKILGIFANTVVMRAYPEGKKKFRDFLAEVKTTTVDAVTHQEYPFEELLEVLHTKRDLSRNPLFDVMFASQNTGKIREIKLQKMRVKPYPFVTTTSMFDLLLNAVEAETTIAFNLIYNTSLFTAATISRFCDHYCQILKQIAVNQDTSIQEISLLTDSERKRILETWQGTRLSFPSEQTIQGLFEIQVERSPEKVAVLFEDRSLTYRQVNESAQALAGYLQTRYAVQPGQLVGVLLERSEWMVIGLLGILKAGAAYVPIDPSYPEERIRYILTDSAPQVILTDRTTPSQAMLTNDLPCIRLQEEWSAIAAYKELKTIPVATWAANTAYVIYTSGSTGKPKGVEITHRNAVAFLSWAQQEFEASDFEVVLAGTSYCFDLSVFELFFTLSVGKSVRVLRSNLEIEQYLDQPQKMLINTVPSVIESLLQRRANFSAVTVLNMAGEPVPLYVKELLDYHTIEVRNLYGPSEDTTYSTCYRFSSAHPTIPIGKPIANTQVYILDEALQLLPEGLVGEICLAGEGLAKGYFNKPELTNQAFVANPFEPDQRMYRTGDVGRWLSDGTIEFIGRKDYQVKVRGYRIELGEVENALLRHEQISQAVVVVATGTDGEKYLVAYYVSTAPWTNASLRSYLQQRLPEYMIPAHFTALDTLPLTPNGKIDRKALLESGSLANNQATEPVEARNELESELVRLWKDTLGVETIGITDNFFEAGGHSLKATRLVALVFKELRTIIELKDIFTHPTIESLAAVIAGRDTTDYQQIAVVEERPFYPLSHAQKRLWILHELEEQPIAYNMSDTYQLEGSVDIQVLERAFRTLIERHQSLRTVFVMVEGEPMQRVLSVAELGFRIQQKEGSETEQLSYEYSQDVTTPFNLQTGPLLRVSLFLRADQPSLMQVTMHHIISDGWSMAVFARDVFTLYAAYHAGKPNPLPALRIQYKDYAVWQNGRLQEGAMEKQRQYWLSQFAGDIPALALATDFERPALKTYHGDTIRIRLEEPISSQVRILCQEEGVSLFMFLVATVKVLLYKYTSQEDIVVGSPIAGRNHLDLEDQIGFYVNTLALRTQFNGQEGLAGLLNKVKQVALAAYEHQAFPFDLLVDQLPLERDMSRSPLFDVMVALQNLEGQALASNPIPGVTLGSYDTEEKISRFDLTFTFQEEGQELALDLTYNTDLFTSARVDRLATYYSRLVAALLLDRHTPLNRISYLTPEEEQQIRVRFNDTTASFAQDATIHGLFERQVAQTPHRIAVVYQETTLTYEQLNEKANQLAHYLRQSYNIGPDKPVGLLMDNSAGLVIGVLGVLKAGGAYVPIAPALPTERKQYLIQDSQLKVLLTDHHFTKDLSCETVLSMTDPGIAAAPRTNPVSVSKPTDLIYMLYTSGTTGYPKGVQIEHRSVVNLSEWLAKTIYLRHERPLTAMLVASIQFDASVQQLFAPLLNGSTLVLLANETKQNPESVVAQLISQQVDVLDCTPAYLSLLLSVIKEMQVPSLKYTLVGGEALHQETVQAYSRSFGQESQLINVYGITECTVNSTYELVSQSRASTRSIGKPLPNTSLYVLDANQQLLPIDTVGELYIGGLGVGRGYVNQPTLTKQRFVSLPVAAGERLYRTGDLARWLADGTLEFIGRNDSQVKLRGYRIELGEIEHRIATHPAVENAVVLHQQGANGDGYLVGYYASKENVAPESVKAHLTTLLPDYMIPSFLVNLEVLPLTLNGKVDRKALPIPAYLSQKEASQPKNSVEEALVAIWQDHLAVDRVSSWDNFFEMGGNSLRALRMLTSIYTVLGVSLSLRDIFRHPTIEGLSAFIHAKGDSEAGRSGKEHQNQPISYASSSVAASPAPSTDRAHGEGITLLSIPYAGGNKYAFTDWKKHLAPAIHLVNLEYPGRENQYPLTTDIGQVVDSIFEQVKKYANQPYALFGHSMGAIVSYLVAKKIVAENVRPPVHLFVSSHQGPQWSAVTKKVHQLPKDKFWQEIKKLNGIPPELYTDAAALDYIERLLRADYEAIENYRYQSSDPFHLPITVFYGKQEGLSEQLLRKSWQRETTLPVTLHAFEGNHFFLFNNWQKMSEIVYATIHKEQPAV